LANITTTRDGKEEMARCEEVFRQICWLEERFWPDVDGMGEQDESSRMGPPMGPMGTGIENGGMPNGLPLTINNGMAGPSGMNQNGNGINMHGNSVGGGSINGPVNNGSMNGPMNNGSMNGPMNNSNVNGSMSNGPASAGPSNPNRNGMDRVG
jgi:hypothetical protein